MIVEQSIRRRFNPTQRPTHAAARHTKTRDTPPKRKHETRNRAPLQQSCLALTWILASETNHGLHGPSGPALTSKVMNTIQNIMRTYRMIHTTAGAKKYFDLIWFDLIWLYLIFTQTGSSIIMWYDTYNRDIYCMSTRPGQFSIFRFQSYIELLSVITRLPGSSLDLPPMEIRNKK